MIVYDVISDTDLVNMIILPPAICDVVKINGWCSRDLSKSIATSSLGDYFIPPGHMVLMNMFLVTWQGTYWGEGGWFRLIRGVDSLNIEEFCSWAVPKDAGKCWSAHGSQKC